MNIPRPEYPRPQMARPVWTNLNGQWEFDFDFSDSGKARGLAQAEHLSRSILVPFCPESRLSGIGLQILSRRYGTNAALTRPRRT